MFFILLIIINVKDLPQGAKDFKEMADKYKQLERNIPKIAGVIAVKTIRENFEVQGFIEEGKTASEKWESRKPETDYAYDNYKSYKGRNYKSSNPILKQTGNLKDAIAYKVEDEHKVFIGVNLSLVPYAKAHNEGLGNLPKRKFLDWSKAMSEAIHKDIIKRRKAIFKYFNKK